MISVRSRKYCEGIGKISAGKLPDLRLENGWKPGQARSDEELIVPVKDRLGRVTAPRSADFLEQLPRSPVGKVLKVDLCKQYGEGPKRAVN